MRQQDTPGPSPTPSAAPNCAGETIKNPQDNSSCPSQSSERVNLEQAIDGELTLSSHVLSWKNPNHRNELARRYAQEHSQHLKPFEQRIEELKQSKKRPRKHLSAFCFYSSIHRADMKRAQPKMQYKQISSLITKQWKNLSPKQKELYVYLQDRDYEDYYALLDIWQNQIRGQADEISADLQTREHLQTGEGQLLNSPKKRVAKCEAKKRILQKDSRSSLAVEPSPMPVASPEERSSHHQLVLKISQQESTLQTRQNFNKITIAPPQIGSERGLYKIGIIEIFSSRPRMPAPEADLEVKFKTDPLRPHPVPGIAEQQEFQRPLTHQDISARFRPATRVERSPSYNKITTTLSGPKPLASESASDIEEFEAKNFKNYNYQLTSKDSKTRATGVLSKNQRLASPKHQVMPSPGAIKPRLCPGEPNLASPPPVRSDSGGADEQASPPSQDRKKAFNMEAKLMRDQQPLTSPVDDARRRDAMPTLGKPSQDSPRPLLCEEQLHYESRFYLDNQLMHAPNVSRHFPTPFLLDQLLPKAAPEAARPRADIAKINREIEAVESSKKEDARAEILSEASPEDGFRSLVLDELESVFSLDLPVKRSLSF